MALWTRPTNSTSSVSKAHTGLPSFARHTIRRRTGSRLKRNGRKPLGVTRSIRAKWIFARSNECPGEVRCVREIVTPFSSRSGWLGGFISGFSPQELLLRQLNPIIRGWANYHRHGAAKRAFARLDRDVFWQLWRWAKRRHPNKSAKWRRRKYFSAAGKWLFSVRLTKEQGQSHVLTLYQAASTRIQRHIKIRGTANPYDPHYTRYFELRRSKKWRRNQTAGNVVTPQGHRPGRSVAHWLQFTAACPHQRAPVGEA